MLRVGKDNRSIFIFGVIIGVISLLYGVLYYISPPWLDDCNYLMKSSGDPGSWKYFADTVRYCYERWQWDTGRLCNMAVAPFLALFPKWVFDLLTSVWIFLLFAAAVVFVKIRPFGWKNAVWILIVAFIIPWRDAMFTTVFAINYIWTVALAAIFIWLQFGSQSPEKAVLLIFVGFITGWWHEGMSAPLLSALSVYYLLSFIIEKNKPSKPQIAALIGLVVGMAMFAVVPGFRESFGWRSNKLIFIDFHWTLYNLFLFNGLFIIFIIAFFIALSVRKTRLGLLSAKRPLIILISIACFGIVSSAVYYLYFSGPRMGMFNQLVCGLGILYLSQIFSACFGLPQFLKSIRSGLLVTAFSVGLVLVNIIAAIIIQSRLTKEATDVNEMIKRIGLTTAHRQIFYDFTPHTRGIDFYKPSYHAVYYYSQINNVSILPTALLQFKNEGDAQRSSYPNVYIFKNHILVEGYTRQNDANYEITLSDGSRHVTTAYQQMYYAPSGHAYIYPKIRYTELHPEAIIVDARPL
ncbi:MAG: DUF6056 family protein [Muribaculum sp.]|nr:DUF6056 family protein [Muribaculum sp.]